MARRVGSMPEVSEAWAKVIAGQEASGFHLRPLERSGWTVAGADLSLSLKEVGINVWSRTEHLLIIVFRPKFPAVEFNLPGSARGSSALADIDGALWLLHTGAFFRGRARPVWDDTVEFDGKTWFRVSSLDDRSFFRNIGRYYLSRQIDPDGLDDEVAGTIENDASLQATEREALVRARRGHGQYRKNLMKVEARCRVTGVSDPRLLVASHIKPWALCETSQERLDGHNGLLLAPHIDHLFDHGYISFGDDGAMLVRPSMDPEQLRRLGVPTDPLPQVGPFRAAQRPYLAFHRDLHGFSHA